MKEKFNLKETLKRNVGFIFRYFSITLIFIIGLTAISKSPDKITTIFLTLGWCYIFLRELKVKPIIVYKNERGDIFEY